VGAACWISIGIIVSANDLKLNQRVRTPLEEIQAELYYTAGALAARLPERSRNGKDLHFARGFGVVLLISRSVYHNCVEFRNFHDVALNAKAALYPHLKPVIVISGGALNRLPGKASGMLMPARDAAAPVE
jgi:hypothetical protein